MKRNLLRVAMALAMTIAGTVAILGFGTPAQSYYAGRCNTYNGILTHSGFGYAWVWAPTASNLDMHCYLSYGASGNGVRILQRTLNRCYGPHTGHWLNVDGSFGRATRDALRAAQRHEGIYDDGGYGNQSRANMAHIGDLYDDSWAGDTTYDWYENCFKINA